MHVVCLERGDLAPDEREARVAGLRLCENRLIKFGKVAARHNRAAKIPGYPLGSPTPDLGARIDAARCADTVDLIEILTEQTAIRAGTRHKVRCPFHDDRKPSLVIYWPGRGWYCHVCHEGSNNLDFAMALIMLENRVEALEMLERVVMTYPEARGGETRT